MLAAFVDHLDAIIYFATRPAMLMASVGLATVAIWPVARRLAVRLPTLPAAAVAMVALAPTALLALLAGLYLVYPSYLDFSEPTMAVIPWLFLQGLPLHHAPHAAQVYMALYGPSGFLMIASIYELLGASIASSKLLGVACLWITLGGLYLALRRAGERPVGALLLLGLLSVLMLAARNHTYLVRFDPLLMALATLALLAANRSRPLAASLVIAAFGALAFNAKATGVVYIAPAAAWHLLEDPRRLRHLPAMALLSAALVAAPFLLPGVPLEGYLAALRMAGTQGFDWRLLMQHGVMAAVMLLALGLLAWPARRALSTGEVALAGTTALAIVTVGVLASKQGAGANHFLPLLPVLGVALAVLRDRARRAGTLERTRPALVATAVVVLIVYLPLGLRESASIASAYLDAGQERARIAEIRAVMAEAPEATVAVGYGGNGPEEDFSLSYLRPVPVFMGQPYPVDAPALMDYQAAGWEVPDALIEEIRACPVDLWLLPRGEAPFLLDNWVLWGAEVFDDRFRHAFFDSHARIEQGQWYDVWACRGAVDASLPGRESS